MFLTKTPFKKIIKEYDIVVGAVPGFMGYKMMTHIVEAGKNVVDISFFQEDPFGLDDLAKEKGVVAVMDCGVAPGMGNIILGHHNNNMAIEDYECLVGGLPEKENGHTNIKQFFAIDVIEDTFVQPAMFKTVKLLLKNLIRHRTCSF